MPKPTLDNKRFLEILKDCCQDGKLDDDKLNNQLCNYFPYDLVFKRRDENENL